MINCVPLFSGSGGNSTYINCGGEEFLIDCGVSCKAVSTALESIGSNIKDIRGIFVTHEHIDHIKGLEVISKNFSIPVYINHESLNNIEKPSAFDAISTFIV